MATPNWYNRRKGKQPADEDVYRLDASKRPEESVSEILTGLYVRHAGPGESPAGRTGSMSSRPRQVSDSRRLSYLNSLVTLLTKEEARSQMVYTTEELMICLRISLVDESVHVRATALRVLRYLIRCEQDVIVFNNLCLPYLVVRCMDLILRNEVERAQALRVVRRVVGVAGGGDGAQVSPALLRCLAAVARVGGSAGDTSGDRLSRPAVATLGEIGVLNPSLFIACGGVSAVTRFLQELATPRMAEALCGVLLHMLDAPASRLAARIDLCCLCAPYCDFNFRPGWLDKNREEREKRFTCSRLSLLCVLRSWPGVLHFCHPLSDSGLRALVHAGLHLHRLDVRKAILDLLYELLELPQPEWTDEISVALAAIDPSDFQDSWRLNDGFVAEEGRSILPHLGATGPDITEIHLALLLYCFLESGLLDGLAEVIVTSDTFISVRATILLGQLLHLIHLLLPPEVCSITPPLPALLAHAASGKPQALAAIAALQRLHNMLEARPAASSLFLDHIIQYCGGAFDEHEPKNKPIAVRMSDTVDEDSVDLLNDSDFFVEKTHRHSLGSRSDCTSSSANQSALVKSKSVSSRTSAVVSKVAKSTKLFNLFERESDNLIRDSLVMDRRDGRKWDWDVIRSILKESERSAEGAGLQLGAGARALWTRRVLNYLRPSFNMYSHADVSGACHDATRAGCQLVRLLLREATADSLRLLEEFFQDVNAQVVAILEARTAHDCLFSPQHMTTTMCQMYFLFAGQLCHSWLGLKLFHDTGLYKSLLDLSTTTHHSCYVKLVISSLDYTLDSHAREILSRTLTCNIDASRLYATQFLNVLLRASQKSGEILRTKMTGGTRMRAREHSKSPYNGDVEGSRSSSQPDDMDTWILKMLVRQLRDESKAVVRCALTILDEACNVPVSDNIWRLRSEQLQQMQRSQPETSAETETANVQSSTRPLSHLNSHINSTGDASEIQDKIVDSAENHLVGSSTPHAREFDENAIPDDSMSSFEGYLQRLIAMRDTVRQNCGLNRDSPPSVRALGSVGDRGYLLWLHLEVAGSSADPQYESFISQQLQFWTESYNLRYVRLIDAETHEALTLATEGGEAGGGTRSVGRRLTRGSTVPPHLHASLAQHALGRRHLATVLPQHYRCIKRGGCSTEQEVQELKASLWALGNTATTPQGVELLLALSGGLEESVFVSTVRLAMHCAVYSVRAAAFYVLGLMGCTYIGANLLYELGWLCVRHTRHDRFPIIQEENWSSKSESNDELRRRLMASPGRAYDRRALDNEASEHSDQTDQSNAESLHSEQTKTSSTRHIVTSVTIERSLTEESCDSDTVDYKMSTPLKMEGRSISESSDTEKKKSHTLPPRSYPVHDRPSLSESKTVDILRDPSIYEKNQFHIGPISESRQLVGRMNSLDHTHEGRMRNTSESSTSGVSSCESMLGRYVFPDRFQTLSPIPSSSSLSAMKGSASRRRITDVPRRTSATSYSGAEVASSPPSQKDMAGYAELKIFNSSRRPHLSESAVPTGAEAEELSYMLEGGGDARGSTRRPRAFSSLRERSRRDADQRNNKLSLLKYDWKPISSSESVTRLEPAARVPGTRAAAGGGGARAVSLPAPPPRSDGPCYIGICLPANLLHIFPRLEGSEYAAEERVASAGVVSPLAHPLAPSSKLSADEVDHTYATFTKGLSACVDWMESAPAWRHEAGACLACARRPSPSTHELREAFFTGMESPRAGLSSGAERSPGPGVGSVTCTSLDLTCSSPASLDCTLSEPHDNLNCEILKHATRMGNPLWHKQTKAALLSLKQKHPEAFQSVCLYSEVSALLAHGSYMIAARRFLQELFLDTTFDCFAADPTHILLTHQVSIKPPADKL